MNENDIKLMIAGGEQAGVEFKRQLHRKGRDFCKEIAAFAGTKGGSILVGVDDDGTVIGLQNAKEDSSRIENWIKEFVDPIPAFNIAVFAINGLEIIYVHIDDGPAMFYTVDDEAFRRIGTSARKLDPKTIAKTVRQPLEVEIRQLRASISQLEQRSSGAVARNNLNWRPTALGAKANVYLDVAAATLEQAISAAGSAGGVQSVVLDQRGADRCTISIGLPASAESVQRDIASRAINAVKKVDKSIFLAL